jgi:hypothetical protein
MYYNRIFPKFKYFFSSLSLPKDLLKGLRDKAQKVD